MQMGPLSMLVVSGGDISLHISLYISRSSSAALHTCDSCLRLVHQDLASRQPHEVGQACADVKGLGLLQAFLSETLEGNKFEIKETLMPDSMHPSAVGMRIIATRLEPLVSQLVASAGDLPEPSR